MTEKNRTRESKASGSRRREHGTVRRSGIRRPSPALPCHWPKAKNASLPSFPYSTSLPSEGRFSPTRRGIRMYRESKDALCAATLGRMIG
jgi:hypothetical protein